MANKRTEKPVLHISLNPDPKDKVTDEHFRQIAKDYMEQMGYGEQPYIVFKHTDIARTHIHIVSTCVDHYSKKREFDVILLDFQIVTFGRLLLFNFQSFTLRKMQKFDAYKYQIYPKIIL